MLKVAEDYPENMTGDWEGYNKDLLLKSNESFDPDEAALRTHLMQQFHPQSYRNLVFGSGEAPSPITGGRDAAIPTLAAEQALGIAGSVPPLPNKIIRNNDGSAAYRRREKLRLTEVPLANQATLDELYNEYKRPSKWDTPTAKDEYLERLNHYRTQPTEGVSSYGGLNDPKTYRSYSSGSSTPRFQDREIFRDPEPPVSQPISERVKQPEEDPRYLARVFDYTSRGYDPSEISPSNNVAGYPPVNIEDYTKLYRVPRYEKLSPSPAN